MSLELVVALVLILVRVLLVAVLVVVVIVAELNGTVTRAAEPAQLLNRQLGGRERLLPEARERRRARILRWWARRLRGREAPREMRGR